MRVVGLERLRTFHVKSSINYIWHTVKFVIAQSKFDKLLLGNTHADPFDNNNHIVWCDITIAN